MDKNTEKSEIFKDTSPVNMVDGVVPIDPVEQQRKEEFEKKQKEISEASEIMKQTQLDEKEAEQEEQYIKILSKRENEALSIEHLVNKSFKSYPCIQPFTHNQNVYFGAQNSLVSEIDINAVGTTADEAVKEYIDYATKQDIPASFKVYPISNALYHAIKCRSEEKVSLNQFPKSRLLADNDIGYDTVSSTGMVDLAFREYPYPSINGILDLTEKLKNRIVEKFSDDNKCTCKHTFLNLYYGSEKVIAYVKIDYNEDQIENNFMNGNKEITTDIEIDNILFNVFYGQCTNEVTSNINNFTNISFDMLLNTWKNNGIFTMTFQFVLEKNNIETSKEITVQCIYTHQDMAPKISVHFNI